MGLGPGVFSVIPAEAGIQTTPVVSKMKSLTTSWLNSLSYRHWGDAIFLLEFVPGFS
jgi:hypothetical protein